MKPRSIKVLARKITVNIVFLAPLEPALRLLLSHYRRQLVNYESVLAYSLLGILGGLASGLVVLAFELSIDELGSLWGIGSSGGDFESLPRWLHFALPVGGAVLLGCVYATLKPRDRETGIVHILSRMHSHYSILPWRNTCLQFIAGTFALATGQSGGREGPGVHLGGAVNSLLGQWLRLPNNSLRMLIACGTAGGISAAFQTPLAGVLFTLEVILGEYTVVSFIPVMLAAVAASTISHALSPGDSLFQLPALQLNSLLELPLIVFLGLCCGTAAAMFIRISKVAAQFPNRSVILRFSMAGMLTGLLALLVPEVLGMGNDTLSLALHGKLALSSLILIALCKLLTTAVSCGVGMPVGLIGPNLLIGACIGGVLSLSGMALNPQWVSDPTLYVVIGMGAAMGAVLNAPLAAVLAIIEMTQSLSISVAAMLAIVTATLTNSSLFKQRSAHQTALHQLKRRAPQDPLNQLLHRTSVSTTMDTRVVRVPATFPQDDLATLIDATPVWCLIHLADDDLYLVDGTDLMQWLKAAEFEDGLTDLTNASLRRWTISSIPLQATLRQAMDIMQEETSEAACIIEYSHNTGKPLLHGVITRGDIEKYTLGSML